MDFRTILAKLMEKYPSGREFSSSEAAGYLGLSKKSVSSYLRRLHRMGLLNGHKRPRSMTIWSGAPRFISCNKGFEYVYVVSKRGVNYVGWMNSRRYSESLQRLNSVIRRSEQLREELGELEERNYKGTVPTGKLQLIDLLAGALYAEQLGREKLTRDNSWLTKELLDSLAKGRDAQTRASHAEAALYGVAIPVIKVLAEQNEALREAARDPGPIREIAFYCRDIGRMMGRSEVIQEMAPSIERIVSKLRAWQLPPSRHPSGRGYAGVEWHEDLKEIETKEKVSRESENADSTNRRIYTKGQLNRIVDSLLHPFAERDMRALIIDGFLHGLIERDPSSSTRKFVFHSLPRMLSQAMMDSRHSKDELEFILRRVIRLARRLSRNMLWPIIPEDFPLARTILHHDTI